MNVTREDIEKYLTDVFISVQAGRYQLSNREKNDELYLDYVFSEESAKSIILSLKVEDFSEAVYNDHPKYSYEILYIFGKEIKLVPKFGGDEEVVPLYIKFNKLSNQYVIIISLHRQEYPLVYKFK